MSGDSCGPAAWNRAYVYFQIPGTVKLDPELHKKDTIYHQTSRRLLGGKTRLVRRLLSYNSCQWFVGCFVPSFFFEKRKGVQRNLKKWEFFPNFLGSCNDLQKHCKPTKFIVKLQLSNRYLKLLPPKIMSWVTRYNLVAYDNKIRSKLTILSYTTICFTKESTVHQKKSRGFFLIPPTWNLLAPPLLSAARISKRLTKCLPRAKHPNTSQESNCGKGIINHPSSIIINLCQKNHLRTDCPPPKKKIVFVLCMFLHENLQWNNFYQKTCPQNKKTSVKNCWLAKKYTKTTQTQKSGVFTAWKKQPFAPSNPKKRRLFFPILPQKPRKGHGLGQNDPNKQSTRCAFCEFEKNPDELDVSEHSGLKPPKIIPLKSRVFPL